MYARVQEAPTTAQNFKMKKGAKEKKKKREKKIRKNLNSLTIFIHTAAV